jgi:hypothetical protein
MSRHGQRREAAQWARQLRKLPGVTVELSAHYKVYLHGKFVSTFGFSPSCSRWLANSRADLRRAGIQL